MVQPNSETLGEVIPHIFEMTRLSKTSIGPILSRWSERGVSKDTAKLQDIALRPISPLLSSV